MMYGLKQKMANIIYRIILKYKFYYLFKSFGYQSGYVIELHRILSKERSNSRIEDDYLSISPDYLRDVIHYFKEKKYTFLSISEMCSQLMNNGHIDKCVVFTFDDGYKDVLTEALPIFKDENIPFVLYVTTSYPSGSTLLWWYMIDEILQHNNTISFTHRDSDYHYKCQSPEQKKETYNSLKTFMMDLENNQITHILKSIIGAEYNKLIESCREHLLTWDDIILLSNEPLITIGAHTINHPVLCNLSMDEAKHEILSSKEIIERYINKSVDHFAYPYGTKLHASMREYILAKDAGYISAATTIRNRVTTDYNNKMHCLPRIHIDGNMDISQLNLWTYGVIPFFKYLFNR
jgi:peptidoglycan/xylan/chitin deacetylase (PgdA/CDA1 family)